MRLLIPILLLTCLSCNCETHNKQQTLQTNSLKQYQKYCLDILQKKRRDFPTDSFQLWTDANLTDDTRLYITKTVNDGFYSYIFWKKIDGVFAFYNETKVPKVGFANDTMYDANGDNYNDFIITENMMNGQCQPKFSQLFCFNKDKGEFVEIEAVKLLPNVTFQPEEKTVSGEWECLLSKDLYKFHWVNDFQLDTIYYKTIKL